MRRSSTKRESVEKESGGGGQLGGRWLSGRSSCRGDAEDELRDSQRNLLGDASVAWFRLTDMYLLRTPSFKFIARCCSNMALIMALQLIDVTVLKADDNLYYWLLMVLWAAGGCMAEYRAFAPNLEVLKYEILSFIREDHPSQYRSDVFNLTDALGFHLLMVSLMLPDSSAYNSVALALWSIAAVLAWLRLLRVLTLDDALGPVVIMCVKMIGDVGKLVVLIFFVLCALTSGTYIVFENAHWFISAAAEVNATALPPLPPGAPPSPPAIELLLGGGRRGRAGGAGSQVDAACIDFYAFSGDWHHWGWTFFVMWNAAFTEEHYTSCVMQSLPEMFWLVWAYSFLFSLATAVLLLNMLIAMMGKTIDNVWEASSTHAQFLFARLTMNQLQQPPEPPPLNVLRLPTYVLALLTEGLQSALPRNAWVDWLVRLLRSSFEYSVILPADSPLAVNVGSVTGDYIGTTCRGRNTFVSWKAAWTHSRLCRHIDAFISKREDNYSQEGRWRVKMMKRINSQFETLRDETRAHRDTMERMFDELHGVRLAQAASAVRAEQGLGKGLAVGATSAACAAFNTCLRRVRHQQSDKVALDGEQQSKQQSEAAPMANTSDDAPASNASDTAASHVGVAGVHGERRKSVFLSGTSPAWRGVELFGA